MLKTLALTFALAASTLLVTDAGAMPLALGLTGDSGVKLVREGCGPGMQYNERQHRCTRDSAKAQIKDVLRGEKACPPGRHWSRRFDRCVRN